MVSTMLQRILRLWHLAFLATSFLVEILATVLYFPDGTLKDWIIRILAAFFVLALCGSAILSLGHVLRPYPFHVAGTMTKTDLDEAWNLGKSIYTSIRKKYPSEDVVNTWWHTYPDGVIRLLDTKDRLWGYFSIWPINRDAFERLKSGSLSEDDIDGSFIESKGNGPFHYWYIADICRKRRPRKAPEGLCEFMVNYLISESFRRLKRQADFPSDAELIAFAATIPGEELLKRFGFSKVRPTVTPAKAEKIYVRHMTNRSIDDIIKTTNRLAVVHSNAARRGTSNA